MAKQPKRDSAGPLPITELPAKTCKNLRGLFSDIDDTISLHGKIPQAAFSALWEAKEAGLRVIPVTGRPAGWVDHIVRMWPVDAVVGENGAFYFYLDEKAGRDGKLVRRFLQDEATRAANKAKLFRLFDELKRRLPKLALASDQQYREIDIALDYCEDVARFSENEVDRMLEHYRRAGAQAKLSSIHVNAWFGDHDKYSTCKLALRELYDEDLTKARDRYLYCGDSPNDEPFFREFSLSVGVANVAEFLPRMQHRPRYLTKKAGGFGFAEAVHHILKHR